MNEPLSEVIRIRVTPSHAVRLGEAAALCNGPGYSHTPPDTKRPRSPMKAGPFQTSMNRLKTGHILSIITWPKPEQDTCVAPAIRRAKS